jgi:hypothetical protein
MRPGEDVLPERNLLILHKPKAEARSDWTEVATRIARDAPDIDVRVVDVAEACDIPETWLRSRPLLVLSQYALASPWTRGGTLFAARDYDKLEQIERLISAGIRVPRTERVSEVERLTGASWGEFAILKPIDGHLGAGVRLLRTQAFPDLKQKLPVAVRPKFIVQPYIDHGDMANRPSEYRVFSFFGRLVYATRNSWPSPRASLAQIANSPKGLIASNSHAPGIRVRALTSNAAVIALGLRAAAAFPELPTVAVDVIRDRKSGSLYVLEVNPKGESWHLSSAYAERTFDPAHRAALYEQFGALDVIASALIERTRAEAV